MAMTTTPANDWKAIFPAEQTTTPPTTFRFFPSLDESILAKQTTESQVIPVSTTTMATVQQQTPASAPLSPATTVNTMKQLDDDTDSDDSYSKSIKQRTGTNKRSPTRERSKTRDRQRVYGGRFTNDDDSETDEETSGSQDERWATVEKKPKDIPNAIPKTCIPYRHRSTEKGNSSQESFVSLLNISTPKKQKSRLIPGRFLHHILSSLKAADPTIRLAQYNDGKRSISNPKLIDDNFKDADDYLQRIPGRNGSKIWRVRIMIHHTLSWKRIRTHEQLQQWMTTESLKMEVTKIKSIHPAIIGFLINTSVSDEHLEQNCIRFLSKIPKQMHDHIDINIGWVEADRKDSSRVLMVRTEPQLVSEYEQIIDTIYNDEDYIQFYLWLDFVQLETRQKYTIVHNQRRYGQKYRHLYLDGFQDFSPTLLVTNEVTPEAMITNETTQVNILEFLFENYTTTTGDLLYRNVLPPINGTIEFLVESKHFSQASRITNSSLLPHLYAKTPENLRSAVFLKNPGPVTTMDSTYKRRDIRSMVPKSTYASVTSEARSNKPSKPTTSIVKPTSDLTQLSNITSDTNEKIDSLESKLDKHILHMNGLEERIDRKLDTKFSQFEIEQRKTTEAQLSTLFTTYESRQVVLLDSMKKEQASMITQVLTSFALNEPKPKSSKKIAPAYVLKKSDPKSRMNILKTPTSITTIPTPTEVPKERMEE
jgi:hypothetical protein